MAVDTNTNELKVPFGLKQGRLYSPQDVDRGLSCECECPGCGSALIANQGKHKRPYFSHYQSRECAGGYESAVHLMAKQIIEDSRYIVVPEFRQSIRKKMPTGDVLSEEVVVLSKRLEFVDVRVEETVDGLRPDVIGVTSDGVEILIEVYVTHAVTDDKRERFAKKNLIELDLSMLPQDLVADEKLFAEEVLSKAGREWISCQLYREEIKTSHQTLQERVKRFITDHRTKVQQAKIEWQAQADRKSELREQYSQHLEQLQNQIYKQGDTNQELGIESIQTIVQRLGCSELPDSLIHEQNGDWIFKTHRTIWQAFIFERFIQGQHRTVLRANDVKSSVIREFGVLEWVSELINLKYQYKIQGRNRGQCYEKKGVWFFTDSENMMIPSPRLLVLNYLKMLANEGLLMLEHPDSDSFTVRLDSFAALESYKADQAEKNRIDELQRKNAALEQQNELEHFQKNQLERRQKYSEDNKKRITYLIALVNSMYIKKGVSDVKRCIHCSHFQELTDGDLCLECNHSNLRDVTLSTSYLKTLPNRLRSLNLFPPSEHYTHGVEPFSVANDLMNDE